MGALTTTQVPTPRPGTQKDRTRWRTCLLLWYYGTCSIHFFVLAFVLATIDYDAYADKRVLKYRDMRFKLLTVWANLMHLAYFPLCWFLTWWEYKGRLFSPRMRKLQQFRRIWFTAILLPTTAYVDSFFWRIWLLDRELLVPSYCDQIIASWSQHCLHTNTAIFIALELVLIRGPPEMMRLQRRLLDVWVAIYIVVCAWTRFYDGYWLYPFLGLMSPWRMALYCGSLWLEHLFWFYLQWPLVALLGRTSRELKGTKGLS